MRNHRRAASALAQGLLVAATLLLGSAIAPRGYSQTENGSITGRVISEDARALPGALVEARASSGTTFTTNTNEDGRYTLQGLPRGFYTVTASLDLDGFETSQPAFPRVLPGEVAIAGFILAPVIAPGTVIVRSLVNAASNLPGYLPQSAISPGSMIVGFTNNGGPVELTIVQELPLRKILNGFSGFILMQGSEYPIYPVYTVETQFAAVVDADTPPGIGNLFIDFNGSQSAAFQVRVVSSQPGFFTLRQNGRGPGIFTQSDFSLITPTKPAQPGDVVIAWGTDASSFDDTPGVENRFTESKVRLFLGNQQLPAEDVFYYGPSAGFAGGLQAIFRVPEGTLNGCAVPFSADVETAADETKGQLRPSLEITLRRFSNIVTLPVSVDGGTCGDRHDLGISAIEKVYFTPAIRGLRLNLTLTNVFDGERAFSSATATLEALEINRFSHQPRVAAGGCTVRWMPSVFSEARPIAVPLEGVYNLDLPGGLSIRLDENSVPSYRTMIDPSELGSLADGPYNYSSFEFSVAGALWRVAGSGNYSGNAVRAMVSLNNALSDTYSTDGFVTFDQALDAWTAPIPELIMGYRFSVGNGQMGSHELECFVSGDPGEFSESRALLAERYQSILRTFPEEAENASVSITLRTVDTNLTPREGAPVDSTEEVFEATSNYDFDTFLLKEILALPSF